MLSSWYVQLNRAKFSNCLSIKIRIERFGLNSDDTTKINSRNLINVTGYIGYLERPFTMCPVPSTLDRYFKSWIARLFCFRIQDTSLKERFLKLRMPASPLMLNSSLRLKFKFEIVLSPLLDKRRFFFVQLFKLSSLKFRLEDFWHELWSFVFHLTPVLIITE